MTKLFETKPDPRTEEATARRRRSQVANQAIDEVLADDPSSPAGRLQKLLGQGQAVSPVVYAKYRKAGSLWEIQHAQVGEDVFIQLFPLAPIGVDWRDVIVALIGVMDGIVPPSVSVTLSPPKTEMKLNFYTIRAEEMATLPGWERALERLLPLLAAVNVWRQPRGGSQP